MSLVSRALLLGALLSAGVAHAEAPALRSATRSFVIHLDAPAATTLPLFGPVRESEWAPDWTPTFLHPPVPTQSEGAVFVTDGPPGRQLTWLLSRFDEAAGEVRYEILAPDFALTRIAIQVRPGPQPARSVATVRYTRMALTPAANEYIEKFERHFESQGPHWESAINAALRSGAAR